MKKIFYFAAFLSLFMAACTPESAEMTPSVIPAHETLTLNLTAAMRKVVPYDKGSIASFATNTSASNRLDYVAYPRKMETHESYSNGTGSSYQTTVYQTEEIAIVPNNDTLLCMMMTLSSFDNRMTIIVEDNRNAKWNYFYLVFNPDGTLNLSSKFNSPLQQIKTMEIHNKIYQDVVVLNNSRQDKLYYTLKNGIIKADLGDGRSWAKL